jgi:dienelactone hydrolase
MMTQPASSSYQLEITPHTSLIDEPVSIRLSGLQPRQHVTIHAHTLDGFHQRWQSTAMFVADEQGMVDLSTQKPLSGSYREADPMGLFWSMSVIEKGKKKKVFFARNKSRPMTVTFSAVVEGATVTTASIQRLFAAPSVTSIAVADQDFVGTLFVPPGPGPHPVALILNGSDGGMRECAASLLASRGYAGLALAYFSGFSGIEDCPKDLIEIPLEYFASAIHWLQEQEAIDGEKIAVIGHSRGGELALLLGATFPTIKAVVGGAPGAYVQSGLRNMQTVPQSAWTHHGKPLPYVPMKTNFLDYAQNFWKFVRHKPFTLRTAFLKGTERLSITDETTIPVENSRGPLLLISGKDDQLWPSDVYAEVIVERLKKYNYTYPVEHVCYEQAGHFVCFPYGLPSLPPMLELATGPVVIGFGGAASFQAKATVDSWQKILAFLARSFQKDTV